MTRWTPWDPPGRPGNPLRKGRRPLRRAPVADGGCCPPGSPGIDFRAARHQRQGDTGTAPAGPALPDRRDRPSRTGGTGGTATTAPVGEHSRIGTPTRSAPLGGYRPRRGHGARRGPRHPQIVTRRSRSPTCPTPIVPDRSQLLRRPPAPVASGRATAPGRAGHGRRPHRVRARRRLRGGPRCHRRRGRSTPPGSAQHRPWWYRGRTRPAGDAACAWSPLVWCWPRGP